MDNYFFKKEPKSGITAKVWWTLWIYNKKGRLHELEVRRCKLGNLVPLMVREERANFELFAYYALGISLVL